MRGRLGQVLYLASCGFAALVGISGAVGGTSDHLRSWFGMLLFIWAGLVCWLLLFALISFSLADISRWLGNARHAREFHNHQP